MGFDVTYHPISSQQMNDWYFTKMNQLEEAEEFAKQAGLGQAETKQYLEALQLGASENEDSMFEKTHGYVLAVIQGLFATYFYTRGTAYSFLIEEQPSMERYITSWQEIKPKGLKCQVGNRMVDNYSGGVYISNQQVNQLLEDYNTNPEIKKIIDDFYQQNTRIFIKALHAAKTNDLGLLEATEVIEPHPTVLKLSECYSDINNCDPAGVLIYTETASKQLFEINKHLLNK